MTSQVDVQKWVISREACYEIKERLDIFGINQASLFPDLDGVAAHIAWLLKWDKWPA